MKIYYNPVNIYQESSIYLVLDIWNLPTRYLFIKHTYQKFGSFKNMITKMLYLPKAWKVGITD